MRGQDGEGFDAEVFAVGAVEVDVEVGDDTAFGDGAGRGGCWKGGVFGEGEGEGAEGAGAGEADGYAGGLAEFVRGKLVRFAEAYEEEALGLEACGGGEEEGFAEGGFEVAGREPGGGGGLERGVGGEEGRGGGSVFRGGGVGGEGYEERGGEVGGGLVEQVGGHRSMVTLEAGWAWSGVGAWAAHDTHLRHAAVMKGHPGTTEARANTGVSPLRITKTRA